jgi:hypothetical protein
VSHLSSGAEIGVDDNSPMLDAPGTVDLAISAHSVWSAQGDRAWDALDPGADSSDAAHTPARRLS